MRLTQFLKRCVSAAAVECPYDKIDEVDTVFLKKCVSASVVELYRGGSATNGANLSSLTNMHIQISLAFLREIFAIFSLLTDCFYLK